jgi:hypothetical protein
VFTQWKQPAESADAFGCLRAKSEAKTRKRVGEAADAV